MCSFYHVTVFWILITIKLVGMTNETDRIVGGTECSITDYPFMVSLRLGRNLVHFCGGSLISKKWILSAAHCFMKIYMIPWQVTAVLGETRCDRKNHGQAIQAKHIYMNEYFSNRTLRHDIALVLLKNDVYFVIGMIQVIQLPPFENISEDLSMHIDGQLTIAGWGSIKQRYINSKVDSNLSRHLRCVNVTYIPYEECRKMSWACTREHICTYAESGGQDSCKGDSGGPLFHGGVQYGIVSWSEGCALPKTPSFNTRVDKYMDFVLYTMQNCGRKPAFLHNVLIIINVYKYFNKLNAVTGL